MKINKINSIIKNIFKPDIFLSFMLIFIVGLLIFPIPTLLIDIFIAFNIAIAIIILLISIYIPHSLKLSSFPSILLITTLLRLGLNVATSRLILLNADAGHMVLAFGNTVVQGNIVVGMVIFLLLMLVNMLVVAKGSERVAEVAARFTLDAMPGKQMSIDADLRSGILDLEQAQKKRIELSQESQLYGAMDGAMKFVKGDVIAGVIIFGINIVAGIIIGTLQHDMDINEALATYAILSVGDGLVSIIPSLLISICAGIMVTRVDGDKEDLGQALSKQILSYHQPFFITSFFLLIMALMPGLPTLPLVILSSLIGLMAFMNKRRQSYQNNITDHQTSFDHPVKSDNKNVGLIPIVIEVADDLIPLVNDASNFINELIPLVRESLENDLGLDFPGIRVRPALTQNLKPSEYLLLLNEIPEALGKAEIDFILVNASPYELSSLNLKNITLSKNPCTHMDASLVPIEYKEQLEKASYMIFDAPGRILLHLSALLRKNAKDFITVHETQMMLDRLESQYAALVREVVPKTISLSQLTDILKRLLAEEVAIKDIKTILQTLAEFSVQEKNTSVLTEYVRMSLKRYLCYRFGHGHNTMLVYLLAPDVEDAIRSSIINQNHGSYLALEPDIAQNIIHAIKYEYQKLSSSLQCPVILTSQDIRRFLRKLIEIDFHEIAVLSYQELCHDLVIKPVGRITFEHEKVEDFLEKNMPPSESPFLSAPLMP